MDYALRKPTETMTIQEITTLIGARCVTASERQIDWLLTDSRSLCFPETTLFFALITRRGDGHRYVAELYAKGVRAFVVSRIPEGDFPQADFLCVPDTLVALQRIGERHRESMRIPVVGITGSNGKTVVKAWLYQLLSPDMVVTRSPRSYNSQVGVPLSVWGLHEGTQLGIFEAGISQPGEMAALQRIIQPTIGVFTCLGQAHQENFESMEQKCREKLLLFRDAEVLFYPAGDAVVEKCVHEMDFRGQLVSFVQGSDALQADRAVCAAVCRHLGMDEAVLEQRLARLEPVAMRLEVLQGQGGCTLINDAYNSDLGSLDIALDFMRRRSEPHPTVILSDMEQTGLPPQTLYDRVASLVQSRGVEHFIGVGPELQRHEAQFSGRGFRTQFFGSADALLQSEALCALSDALVLVKGARSFHFERLVEALELQRHETILEVNLSAVVENLNRYRSFLRPETKMVCMVKADAYGAGAIQVAKTLQDHRVDYLAVAVADEGVALRQSGITMGIMIMNPEMGCLRTLFDYRLEPEVYSFRLLDALIAEGERQGVQDFPIHIKLDTGMHRLGFDPERDVPQLLERLSRQTALLPRSVFSHFVGSDSADFDAFSARQAQLFGLGADALQAGYRHHILRHICNSAAIEHFPQRQMDMVRLGLGLYGINPLDGQTLSNVSTLRTTILQIHHVPAGETVGYSRRTTLERDSRIAALPIGYADGLNRRLGNRHGYCLVCGERAPYVGNICMDVCMIDVTDIPCREGDEALIFGRQLPTAELAEQIGTIPYEILTAVSNRVKRVYFRE